MQYINILTESLLYKVCFTFIAFNYIIYIIFNLISLHICIVI